MLERQTVTVGKCYVNNQRKVAREVVGADLETVRFITYHLDTGNSCGSPSECTRQDFIQWADREASPAEIARLQSKGMDALFRAPQAPNWAKLEHDMAIDLERVTPETG
jgi:hypothetical protein